MNIECTPVYAYEMSILRRFYAANAWYFSVETMLKVRRLTTMDFDTDKRYIYNQLSWIISVSQTLRLSLLLILQIEEGVGLQDVTIIIAILKELVDSARSAQEVISGANRF